MNMDRHYQEALDEAIAFIDANYAPLAIIVSGSIVRGNPNAGSDFDIFVIHAEAFRQRVQRVFKGVACEIFVNNLPQAYAYFDSELTSNRPVTANMISTGVVIRGGADAAILRLVADARRFAEMSPVLTPEQLLFRRYGIVNLFEDAVDVMDSDLVAAGYIIDKVVLEVVDYLFLLRRRPLPRIKERMAELAELVPDAGSLVEGFYHAVGPLEELEWARKLVLLVAGETGFFEWESARDSV